MPSKKRKNSTKDDLEPKIKLTPFDPTKDRFRTMKVLIPNMTMPEVCRRLFGEEEGKTVKFEIQTYQSVVNGTVKHMVGETFFVEECKVILEIAYEKGKEPDLDNYFQEKLPSYYVS